MRKDSSTIPLPNEVKQSIEDALVALSLANLIFLKVSFDLLSDSDRFFNRLPATTPMFLALIVNMLAVGLVVWLLIGFTRRIKSHWLQLPFHLLFMAAVFWPLDFIRIKFFNITDAGIYNFMRQPAVMLALVCVFSFVVWKHGQAAKLAGILYGILSPLAIFNLVKVGCFAVGVLHLKQCDFEPTAPSLHPFDAAKPRVVWVIFDETDYRLAYEQRPPNVKLPEFDRFRAEALSSTAAYSPGDGTGLSMPSLIIGEQIIWMTGDDSCDATVTFASSGKTANWSGLPSVFSQAQALGFNTALVGWYIPYERILGGSLNYCSWYSYPVFEPVRSTNFTDEVEMQLASLGETFYMRQEFVKMHRHSLQDALSVAANPDYGLTLLHLPAPHRPGVYLPDQHRLTMMPMNKVVGYMNNVAFADYEFGEIRKMMEKSGLWDKTWVILSSDHSWRESRLYDKVRDLRVPFLVKPPGTNAPAVYDKQFNTVLTHDLILSILESQVTNQQNIIDWLDAHSPAQHFIPTPSAVF